MSVRGDFVQSDIEAGWCPFGLGQPDEELLGNALIAEASVRVAAKLAQVGWMVQYGHRGGPRSFREAVANELVGNGWKEDQVALTSGISGALGTIASRLSSENERRHVGMKGCKDVICEVPTYFLAQGVFQDAGCRLVGVPRGWNDVDTLSEIRMVLEQREREGLAPPAMIYTIPYFHNPCGCSFTDSQVQELVQLAEAFDTFAVFDEPYNMLSFDGIPRTHGAVLSSGSKRVISLGSFSKILAPGLRTGYLLAHQDTLQQVYFSAGSIASGGGANPLTAQIVTELIQSGQLAKHVEHTRVELKKRMGILLDALEKEGLGPDHAPDGGYFTWVPIGKDTKSETFKKECQKERITVTPGFRCVIPQAVELGSKSKVMETVTRQSRHSVRLCVAHVCPNEIVNGIQALARVLKRLPH